MLSPSSSGVGLSGLYKGRVVRSIAQSEIADILDINLLIAFTPVHGDTQIYKVHSVTCEFPEPRLFVGTFDDLGGLQLTCYSSEIISSYSGHIESTSNRMILTSKTEEICLKNSGSILCGISEFLSGIWQGRVTSPQKNISKWTDFPLEFRESNHAFSLIVKGKLQENGEDLELDGLFDLRLNKLLLNSRSQTTTMIFNAIFQSNVLEFNGRESHSIHLKKTIPRKLELIFKENCAFDVAVSLLVGDGICTNPSVNAAQCSQRPHETLFQCTSTIDSYESSMEYLPSTSTAELQPDEEELQRWTPISKLLNHIANEVKGNLSGTSIDLLQELTQKMRNDDGLLVSHSNLALHLLSELDKKCSVQDIRKENENICHICCSSLIDCVLLPCGHLAACLTCAKKIEICPYDREIIQKLQPVFRV